MKYLLSGYIEKYNYDNLDTLNNESFIDIYNDLRTALIAQINNSFMFDTEKISSEYEFMMIENLKFIDQIKETMIQEKRYIILAKIEGHANIMFVDRTNAPVKAYYVEPNNNFDALTQNQIVELCDKIPLICNNLMLINDINLQQDGFLCYVWCLLLIQIMLINSYLETKSLFTILALDTRLTYGLIYMTCYQIYQIIDFKTEIDKYKVYGMNGLEGRQNIKWRKRLLELETMGQHGSGIFEKYINNKNTYEKLKKILF